MNENYTYEDALALVDRESPASSNENKKFWAEKIIKEMIRTGDSPERIWLFMK